MRVWYMKRIVVKLKDRSYPIIIGRGALSRLAPLLKKISSSSLVVIVTNGPLSRLYRSRITSLLSRHFRLLWIVIPEGEHHKNLKTVESIYKKMVQAEVTRKTVLVALGGGVVGDIAGFAAATYLRGIPFVQIPTSLLAQVDSSVGGKVGVDLPAGKNLVGSFHQPKGVIIDPLFLSTLPRGEYLCGLAEVIKYGILWDEHFFRFIENNIGKILRMKDNVVEKMIARSCEIKAEIVSRDEREAGLRSLLNLGHTLGHALEALSHYRGLKHGEAVAVGMVFSATLSLKRGICKPADLHRMRSLLERIGLPITWPLYSKKAYEKVMAIDKKNVGDKINFVAIRKIGKSFLLPLKVKEIVRYI